jgi:hypothetical protein
MQRILCTDLTYADLHSLGKVVDHGVRRAPWDELSRGELTAEEQRQIDYVSADLRRFQPSLVNETTVFARAIFPLLVLAEVEGVQALADVPLKAHIGDVEIAGVADGALGRPFAGELLAPFMIMIEAKRGVEGTIPVLQLYGEMLAAACLNAIETGRPTQSIYGCYTVADDWTFVRMAVEGLDTPHPSLEIVSSYELGEKVEAVTIVKILKSIVAEHGRTAA